MSPLLQELPAPQPASPGAGSPVPPDVPGLAAMLGAGPNESVRVRLLHAPRNRTKARVWCAEAAGRALVVKEITASPRWMRWAFARSLLKREARIGRALEGLAGVPAFVSMPTPDILVMSYLRAVPLPRWPRERLTEGLFDRLDRLVGELHARGVACGDVHHRNVLVSPGGDPSLVDFAVATRRGGRWNVLRTWIWNRLAELDDAAALRMRLRYLRRAPTAAEKARLDRGARLWTAGRSLKRALRAGRTGGSGARRRSSRRRPGERTS